MKFTIYFLSFFLVFSQSILADIYSAKQWQGPAKKTVNAYRELHISKHGPNDQNPQFDYLKKIFDEFSQKHPGKKLYVLVESPPASEVGKMLIFQFCGKRHKLLVKFSELFKSKSLENMLRNNIILYNVDDRMILEFYNRYFNHRLERYIYLYKEEYLQLFTTKTLREIFEYVWGEARNLESYKKIYQKKYSILKKKLLDAGFDNDEIETTPLIALFNGAVIEENQEKIKMFQDLFNTTTIAIDFGLSVDAKCLRLIKNSKSGSTIVLIVGWCHIMEIEKNLAKMGFECKPGCGHQTFARNENGEIVKSIHSDEEAMTLVPVSNDVFNWILE